MGLLDWIFKSNNFTRVDDAFALNRERLWEGFRKSLELPNRKDKSTWLIVHFMDTFTVVQELLEQWRIEYEIVASRLNGSQLGRAGLLSSDSSPSPLKLILAELVPDPPPSKSTQPIDDGSQVAMIVLERHPQIRHDNRLESFARSLPLKVEFGYFLSLDDAVVKISIDDQVIQVLQQLGLNEELISSDMVTRRLKTVLKRISPDFTGDTPSNSAAQWLQINAREPNVEQS